MFTAIRPAAPPQPTKALRVESSRFRRQAEGRVRAKMRHGPSQTARGRVCYPFLNRSLPSSYGRPFLPALTREPNVPAKPPRGLGFGSGVGSPARHAAARDLHPFREIRGVDRVVSAPDDIFPHQRRALPAGEVDLFGFDANSTLVGLTHSA